MVCPPRSFTYRTIRTPKHIQVLAERTTKVYILPRLDPLTRPLFHWIGCFNVQDNEGNEGGAIYNEGKVTMFQPVIFFDNACAVSFETGLSISRREICSRCNEHALLKVHTVVEDVCGRGEQHLYSITGPRSVYRCL